jgi:hypothetical protein
MTIIKCDCGISYNESNKRHILSKTHKDGIKKKNIDDRINKVVDFIKNNSKMFKNIDNNYNIKKILVDKKIIDKDDDILITTIDTNNQSSSDDDSDDSCADSDKTYEPSDDEEGDVENA